MAEHNPVVCLVLIECCVRAELAEGLSVDLWDRNVVVKRSGEKDWLRDEVAFRRNFCT